MRKIIETQSAPAAIGPYSQAVMIDSPGIGKHVIDGLEGILIPGDEDRIHLRD